MALASGSPSSESAARSNGPFLLPLLPVVVFFNPFDDIEEVSRGESLLVVRALSIEKSSCLFTGGCDGVLPLTFPLGEDSCAVVRGMGLRADPVMWVLIGEIDRGMLVLAFRTLLTTTSGSAIVPFFVSKASLRAIHAPQSVTNYAPLTLPNIHTIVRSIRRFMSPSVWLKCRPLWR